MYVLIRADASASIGSGHVMRCMTLAEELKNSGATVGFICRVEQGDMIGYIENKGFSVIHLVLPVEDEISEINAQIQARSLEVDWFIVDHYQWNTQQEASVREFAGKIMVIDDLANRSHDCDLLLDQNYVNNFLVRYNGLIPDKCRTLLGPQYAILKSDFIRLGKEIRKVKADIRRVLIFFSASDPHNATLKALYAIESFEDLIIDVVVGASNPLKDEIERYCEAKPTINFHCQIENMAELMNQADLAIGAGGTATWERCMLGLPSIVVGIAENQMPTIEALDSIGAIKSLGWHEHVSVDRIAAVFSEIVGSLTALIELSSESRKIMGERYSACDAVLLEMYKK